MAKKTQNGTGHRSVSVMNAASSGPAYGLITMNDLVCVSLKGMSC
jgi:hypothetical protein